MSAAAYTSISSSSPSLNAAQKEAVMSPLNIPSVCIAGPGSGKTKVLTHRIEHMIKDLKQGPKSILAITFTNKAAMEMNRRLTSLLGEAIASSVTIATFHSFSCKLLRSYGSDHLKILTGSNDVTGNFSIYDQDECLKIVKELMKRKNIVEESIKPASVLNAISNIKEARVMAKCSLSLEGAYAHILSQEGELILSSRSIRAAKELVFEYDKILHGNNALDFQDLLLCAYKLLGVREVANTVMSRWQHVLVDEYQDTNVPQYEIIQALSPPSFLKGSPVLETINPLSKANKFFQRSLFVVGDVNQAIYSWRGARPSNLASLIRSYPNIRKFGLLENYRCSKPITAVS
jgi:DNA helicase II / ATP-dependent DNA helicase PcrA